MTLWIDDDAMPRAVKELVLRASERRQLEVVIVANRRQAAPASPLVRVVQVSRDPDAADIHVADHCTEGDLVITADLPLAACVVEKGCLVVDPRGRILDEENVQEALNLRDLSTELRASGLPTSGPPPFGRKDRERFANALDRCLTRLARRSGS